MYFYRQKIDSVVPNESTSKMDFEKLNNQQETGNTARKRLPRPAQQLYVPPAQRQCATPLDRRKRKTAIQQINSNSDELKSRISEQHCLKSPATSFPVFASKNNENHQEVCDESESLPVEVTSASVNASCVAEVTNSLTDCDSADRELDHSNHNSEVKVQHATESGEKTSLQTNCNEESEIIAIRLREDCTLTIVPVDSQSCNGCVENTADADKGNYICKIDAHFY